MRLGTSFSKLLAAGALVFGASLVFQACAKQSEAERCEVDSDCESGLTCKFQLYCCPPAGQETTAECRQTPTPTTDAAVPDTTPVADTGADTDVDTGAVDTGAADTGTADTADTGLDADALPADTDVVTDAADAD